MTTFNEAKQPDKVRAMFSRIAGHYDLMNRVMSFGMDVSWRRRMIRNISVSSTARILDLGAGTGDLSRQVLGKFPNTFVSAADFTLGMLTAGKRWENISRSNADALNLPFADRTFDLVMSGFLVRNVVDVDQALVEQARVLKPGSPVFILDMTQPRKNFFTPLIRFYMNTIVPLVGTLIAGQKEAYTYLPDSTQHFLKAEELAEKMRKAGFANVEFEILNFGTVAIHHGILPPDKND